jgi:hypothetical protein
MITMKIRKTKARLDRLEERMAKAEKITQNVTIGDPKITLHTSTGYIDSGHTSSLYVKRGRWWAEVAGVRLTGEVMDPGYVPLTRAYEGYATPAAAEKAAKEYLNNRPAVKGL